MKTKGLQILDPRNRQKRNKLVLAGRVTRDDLRRGPVLFYDNTKLSFCYYGVLFKRLKENFAKDGITNIVDFCETVRGKTPQDLKDYAAKLAKTKPVAAIIALGDMGTSPATTIITIALEALGVPCVYITAPPGSELVKAVAFYRAGQLCLCKVDIYQGSTAAEVAREIDRQMDCIYESLTLPPAKIGKRANLQFGVDAIAPRKDGMLTIRESKNTPEGITESLAALHIGDGLPVIPPTPERYEQMLAFCPFDPGAVLASNIGPAGMDITVKDVAVAAVMAGCKPEYMPVLVTAFKAMADPKYNFLQSVTTSHPGGNLVLVSGPLAQETGIHGGQGCIGPGFRANMTIGRAVNLAITNVCRVIPGHSDLACISSQAELAYCFAEDPALTPWNMINEERFDKKTTTVYVLKAEPPHDIIDFLSQTGGDLMDTIVDCATTLGSNNAYIPGNLIVVITPDHALLLHRDGWDKNKIREHIHLRACHAAALVRDRGLVPVRPKGWETKHPMPVTRSSQDVDIVVVGGRGGHSSIILPWALHSEAIIQPVLLPNGKVPKSIKDFRRK